MTTRTHLTFVFDEAGPLAEIAALRRRFDPAMAAGVPPHVTLVYPEEHHNDLATLVARSQHAAETAGRFTLRCGAAVVDGDDGAGGVFVEMHDESGTWSELRAAIVQPPFERLDVQPHLTIVHPRTSDQGSAAWNELRGREFDEVLAPDRFSLTVTDVDQGLRIEESFALGAPRRALVAGVVPVDGDRVLLGLRSRHRTSYPGVWDVIGGHVEAGESVADAARREVAEEVDLRVGRLRHVDTVVGADFELVLFATSDWSGEIQNLAPDEHERLEWHPFAHAADLDLAHPALGPLLKRAVDAVAS